MEMEDVDRLTINAAGRENPFRCDHAAALNELNPRFKWLR